MTDDPAVQYAKSQLQLGKACDAEADFRQVLEREPDCAEANHFLGMALLQQGRLEQAFDSVRRSVEIESNNSTYHSNFAMVLGALKKYPESLQAAERAIQLQPDCAEAWNNKGIALDKLRRRDEATAAFREAVRIRLDYVEAIGNLGDVLSRQGMAEEAIEVLKKAAALRPQEALRHKSLANALRRAGRSQEAVLEYRIAIELKPNDADAYNNLGASLSELGQIAEAEEVFRHCLSLQPNHIDGHVNLSLALLSLGRWTEGWVQYEWRRHLKSDVNHSRRLVQPEWNGAKLKGSTILVCCEQGLGDAIQFIRYIPLLMKQGARVILECQPKSVPLFRQLSCVEKVIPQGEPLPAFDAHARLLSLPGIFGTTPQTVPADVPYLQVEPDRIERVRALLGPRKGLRVGLVWQGSDQHKRDRFRSIPLEKLAPLVQVPGVQWISLQKGKGAEQIEACRGRFELIQWSDPVDMTGEALVDTAAMIKGLDLVIAVDTAIAHLAGALGVPVWMAVSYSSDWRWLLDREDTPWYPTMRLFRQTKLGGWEDVIERMVVALREKLNGETSTPEVRLSTSGESDALDVNGGHAARRTSRKLRRIEKELANLRRQIQRESEPMAVR